MNGQINALERDRLALGGLDRLRGQRHFWRLSPGAVLAHRKLGLLVCVGVWAGVAHARRGESPTVVKVPTVEEVVAAEGFVPTPSQTELYRPGAVLVPNSRGGHDAVVEDCIGVEPAISIMSQSSIATTLSAGVSTRLGVGSAAATAGVEKRLTFIDPEQRTISLGRMRVTDDCKGQLETAARLQDLSEAVVVHDVLVAIIQNTVCTRADAKGGLIALGAAEAAAYSECVQESDAQVPLGYKAVPLDRLVGPAQRTAPAATAPGLDFGGTADMGVQAQLAEQECQIAAQSTGELARKQKLVDEVSAVQLQASSAWAGINEEATACVGLPKAQRLPCIQAVQKWLLTAQAMPVSLPAGIEPAQTACGKRDVAFPAESQTVVAREVNEARALLNRLQRTADPHIGTVVVSAPLSSSQPIAALEAQYRKLAALKIDGPARKSSQKVTSEVLKDQLVAKAKALQQLEALALPLVKSPDPDTVIEALWVMGQGYEDMGAGLISSHIPDFLNPDQQELYRMGLEDKAFVQTEKAVSAYKTLLDKAHAERRYTPITRKAIARLEELRPRDFPPMHEPLDTLDASALEPVVEALQHRDYTEAKRRLGRAPRGATTQRAVAEAIIARGLGDDKTAAAIYAGLSRSDAGSKPAAFCGAAYFGQHQHNYKKGRKMLEAYIYAHAGQVGPDHPVFARIDQLASAQSAHEVSKAQAAKKKAQQEERARRQNEALKELDSRTDALRAFHRGHASCGAYASAIGEEVAMVLEQAEMVVEAEEADMAADVLMFIDQVEPLARETAATCR